ncbi:MAG: efflux RND transporter permease subunit, partial [Pirellulaceae bacterium]
RRLRGSFFADDLETTCLIARLSPHGFANRSQAMQLMRQAIHDQPELTLADTHLAGKAVASVSINEFTNTTLLLGIPGALLAVLVMYLCLGSVRLTLACGYVAAIAGVSSLAMVPLFGYQVNGLLVLMPVLVFVLTLSAAVHLIRALQRFLQQPKPVLSPVDAALQQTRRPIILSLLTTAVGLGSLCISHVSAVVQFGLFSATSLLLALIYVLFLLPALLRLVVPRREQTSPGTDNFLTRLMTSNALVQQSTRWPVAKLLLFAVISLPAIKGLTTLQTDLHVYNLFAHNTKISSDYHWINQNLFPLGRVEVVVEFPTASQLNRYGQLQQVRRVQASLIKYDGYHSATSVANFIRIPRASGPMERHLVEQMISTQLDSQMDLLHREGMLHSDDDCHRWRISVSCPVDEDDDEQEHAERLEILARGALGENPDDVSVAATGMGPVAATGQRRLFSDLARSLGLALLAITPILVFSLGSLRLGLIAMIPNMFPILIVLGYSGLSEVRLTIGALLTASVGLGIAIDSTVHFLHFYRLGREQTEFDLDGSRLSVQFAMRHCASPILSTSFIICIGLSTFAFSLFVPASQFAISLILMMIVAAIADLVLLPAILIILSGVRGWQDPVPLESQQTSSANLEEADHQEFAPSGP